MGAEMCIRDRCYPGQHPRLGEVLDIIRPSLPCRVRRRHPERGHALRHAAGRSVWTGLQHPLHRTHRPVVVNKCFALRRYLAQRVQSKSILLCHYTQRVTVLSFILFSSRSSDGRVLVVSSSDGFCSIITFDDGELGPVYVPPEERYEVDAIGGLIESVY